MSIWGILLTIGGVLDAVGIFILGTDQKGIGS